MSRSPYGGLSNIPLTPNEEQEDEREYEYDEKEPLSNERKNKKQESSHHNSNDQPSFGWSASMALFSPPQTFSARNRTTPFQPTSIDRTARTPIYNISNHNLSAQKKSRSSKTDQQANNKNDDSYDDNDSDQDRDDNGALPTMQNPWLSQTGRVESLIDESSPGRFSNVSRSPSHRSVASSLAYSHTSARDNVILQSSSDLEMSVASSTLLGENIFQIPSVETVDTRPKPSTPSKTVSFKDIEAQHQPTPTRVEDRRMFMRQSISSDVSDRFLGWGRHANDELSRVSEMTRNELMKITKAASNTALHVFQKPTFTDDLDYLQGVHRSKMLQMTCTEHEDHFDFVLVLTPQAAYEFWAEHLDFRSEFLGEEYTIQKNSSSNADTTNTENSDENVDQRLFTTPSAGIRHRKTSTLSDDSEYTAPYSAPVISLDDTDQRVINPRLSLFEKAIGIFSPNKPSLNGSASKFFGDTPISIHDGISVTSTARRRRWGNRYNTDSSTPDVMSPPIRSISRRKSSVVRKRRSSTGSNSLTSNTDLNGSKRSKKDPNSLSVEDIPSQVIPRGIAARTNGMIKFLSYLKRGIVLRRHKPGGEATFVKIFSTDGGDTIKYEPVETAEALLAFKEQSVRHNKKWTKNAPTNGLNGEPSKKWIEGNKDDDTLFQSFSLPDFIAAEKYRKKQQENKQGLHHQVMDAASKLKNSGAIRTAEIIAVHPATHEDPRTSHGERGTISLRKSKTEFHPPHTFSIVLKVGGNFTRNKSTTTAASERWYSGEGSDVQFRTIDFEAATVGEYWLIFRGFLLLHRDAASGRFASHRSAGFGSNYTNVEDFDDRFNLLQKDAFHEPKTIGRFEKWMADIRKIDLTRVMHGYAEPDAVPPPSDYFLGFKSPGTQIWSRLRQAGLETTRIYHIDTRRVMIKVRCPADRLTDVAEVLKIKLKTTDGIFAPFRENNIHMYKPLNDDLDAPKSQFSQGASLFRSSERQTVIDFIIRSRIRDSGAELGENTDLGKLIVGRIPIHMPMKVGSLYNAWFYFWRKQNWTPCKGRYVPNGSSNYDPVKANDCLDQSITLEDENMHSDAVEKSMPNIILRFFIGAFHQPLDSVEQYFGEKVAFYFAWLQHCSNHLVFLACCGLFVTVLQVASGNYDHPIRPYFSMVLMIWSFVVLVSWKQQSNLLAYRWGTIDHREQETTRPQFKGEYHRDEISGEWIVVYPAWKRYLKYLISLPITLAFTFGTLLIILLVHANRDVMLAKYYEHLNNSNSTEFELIFSVQALGQARGPLAAVEITPEILRDVNFWIIIAGMPTALGIFLPLLNLVLMKISYILTDFENYRTESQYRTNLIIKVFSFRFVCYFATLYYYSFAISIAESTQEIDNGLVRVASGVFIYTTVAHWWGTFLQFSFPLLVYSVRRRSQKKRLKEQLMEVEMEEARLAELSEEVADTEEVKELKVHLVNRRLLLDQAQDELWREVMLPMHDSFPEYIQAVVQFAYVTCFSTMLPITPIIVLMNHLVSMRLDAHKLCKTRRRPLAQKTGGIGVWEHVLHVVSVIAVLTNCWLMGFTTSQFRWLGKQITEIGLFACVVGWEHVMLLIKYIMQASIPKIPKVVQDAIKRDQLEQAKKARSVSMRGKKDRRSQSFRRVNSIFVNRSEGLSPEPSLRWGLQEKQRSTRSILRNRNPDHNIGLTTIQSGEMSPASNDDTSRQSDKENENHVNTSSVLNGVKTRSLSESVASSHFDIPTPRHLPMEAEATPQPPRHDSQNVTDPVSECIKTAKSYEDEDVAMHRDDDLAYDEGIELLLNESDDETSLAMVSLSSGKRDSESANTLALQRIEARLSGLQSMRLSQELHEC